MPDTPPASAETTAPTSGPDHTPESWTRSPVLFWTGAVTMLWILRLPYLFSRSYILDNDEAVLGLMARRMVAGTEFPLFFWGQRYGLSIFETFPVAIAFKVFGDSPRVLPLAILVVFLTALPFWCRAFVNLTGSLAWGRVLTLALGLLPAWVVWSMKARGIYVSGFLLTGLALALLTRPSLERRHLVTLAVLLGLLWFVQPLWFCPILPLLLLPRIWTARDLIPAAAALGLTVLVLRLLVPSGPAYWNPELFGGFALDRLSYIPNRLGRAFMGQSLPQNATPLTRWTGWLLSLVYFFVLVVLGVQALRTRDRRSLFAAAAMAASVAPITAMVLFPPRYLLPATLAFHVGIATWLGVGRVAYRGPARAVALGLIAILWGGAAGMGLERGLDGGELVPAEQDIMDLLNDLEANGIRGVYTPHSDLQWQLLFYGRERIPTRGVSAQDRYPAFPRAVSRARAEGARVSLVADILRMTEGLPIREDTRIELVAQRYIRIDDPPTELLSEMGFEPVPSRDPPDAEAVQR